MINCETLCRVNNRAISAINILYYYEWRKKYFKIEIVKIAISKSVFCVKFAN